MVRWLVNYIRQCTCKHDFELLWEIMEEKSQNKEVLRWTYRCKKCGFVQRVRL